MNNLTDGDLLLKNKAERIISVNKDISTGALIDKLKKKGIPQGIIDDVVEFDEERELNNALRAIKAKYPLIKGKTDYERKQKLLKYLLSKGFDYQLAQRGVVGFFDGES